MITLTPAYGRDYRTAKEAREAYLGDVDWILNDITSRWDGKPANRDDMEGKPVKLRFCRLRKVAMA